MMRLGRGEKGLVHHRLLTAFEERRLFGVLRDDPDLKTDRARRAREKVIRHNFRLVVKQANSFYLPPGSTLDRDDLFQAGVEGLMRAVGKYDLARGTRFSTCAVPWIRQAIGRHVDDACSTIRVPVNVRGDLERASRIAAAIRTETGREPCREEIALAAGLSENRLRYTELARAAALPAYGLDGEVGGDAPGSGDKPGSALGSLLADPRDTPEEEVLGRLGEDEAARCLDEALDSLPGDLMRILYMRYGLRAGDPMTLDEVGREVG